MLNLYSKRLDLRQAVLVEALIEYEGCVGGWMSSHPGGSDKLVSSQIKSLGENFVIKEVYPEVVDNPVCNLIIIE